MRACEVRFSVYVPEWELAYLRMISFVIAGVHAQLNESESMCHYVHARKLIDATRSATVGGTPTLLVHAHDTSALVPAQQRIASWRISSLQIAYLYKKARRCSAPGSCAQLRAAVCLQVCASACLHKKGIGESRLCIIILEQNF